MEDGTRERLGDWIDRRHLCRGAMASYRARFESDALTSLVLDDFVLEGRLSLLQRCFHQDAVLSRNYGLIEPLADGRPSFAERAVDEATFNRSPEQSRLARESVMAGHAVGRRASEGWMANLDFIDLLGSSFFAEYLTAITGIRHLDEMSFLPRVMKWGDFCRAHDDTAGTRRLCMLFYVDDGWRPGFGGRFQHVVNGKSVRNVEPLANRVLIHEPRIDQIHQVESFTRKALRWERSSYSVWYSRRE